MIVEVRGADAEPEITYTQMVAAGIKKLLDERRPRRGLHPDDLLGAAAGQGVTEAVHHLKSLPLVNGDRGSLTGLAGGGGKFQRRLWGEERGFVRVGQPDFGLPGVSQKWNLNHSGQKQCAEES